MTDSTAVDRRKDILLMTIAIQLSVLGTASSDGTLVPLALIGILITVFVVLDEIGRRLVECTT